MVPLRNRNISNAGANEIGLANRDGQPSPTVMGAENASAAQPTKNFRFSCAKEYGPE